MQQPSLFSFRGFFRLTRVWNLLIIIMTQLFTAVFLLHKEWNDLFLDLRFVALLLSTVIIAAAGYIINDYYDVKIDFINRPDRVVVGKTLKRRVVMVFHLVLNSIGTILGILISWKVLLVNLFSIFLLWGYSNQLKRWPFVGNLSISILTGLTLLVVGVYFENITEGIVIYSAFAFFFTLIREVIKDMQDMKGDEAFGCKTLPIIWGIRTTKRFLYLLMILFTISLWLSLNDLDDIFWVSFFSGLTLVQIVLSLLLFRADTVRHFGMLSQVCKIIMLLGIFTMTIYNLKI